MYKGVSKNITRRTESNKSGTSRKANWLKKRTKIHPFLMKNNRQKLPINTNEQQAPLEENVSEMQRASVGKNLILEKLKSEREAIVSSKSNLEINGHLDGKVTAVSRLGVFVDIGGAIGLVKLKDFQLDVSEGETIRILGVHVDEHNESVGKPYEYAGQRKLTSKFALRSIFSGWLIILTPLKRGVLVISEVFLQPQRPSLPVAAISIALFGPPRIGNALRQWRKNRKQFSQRHSEFCRHERSKPQSRPPQTS